MLGVARVKYFGLALSSNERRRCHTKLRMLSFCNSIGIPNPVTDGIRVNIRADRGSGSGGRFGELFTTVTSIIDGIRVGSTHPRYYSQNSYKGGGALVVKIGGCEGSSTVIEGGTNTEL